MYASIHVPLDGSSHAEQALPLAVSLARRDGAALQVVRAREAIAGVYIDRPGTFEALLDRELMERDQAYLDAVVERLCDAGIRVSTAIVKGPIAEALGRHTATSGADLLVMTTHARDALGRFWFGSVADALVRQSSLPLLIVRPHEAAVNVGDAPVIRHVLIALDGSELAELAIEPAVALGGESPTEYTLLRVVRPIVLAPPDSASVRFSGLDPSLLRKLDELHDRRRDDAASYLEQVAARFRSRSRVVHTRVVLNDQPAAVILEESARSGADAIAMTTRGEGGLKRLLLGSITNKVIRGATTPILVCPADVEPRRSAS